MSVLVIDVGTSNVRAARVEDDGRCAAVAQRRLLPARPAPGVVELDALGLAKVVRDLALGLGNGGGPIEAVGIAAQRATTLLWSRDSGEPVGPGISWQDLRTAGRCLALRAQGIRMTPNQSATKLAYLLDTYDRTRSMDVCFGTVESYVAWVLSEGTLHASDASNAAVTGLVCPDASAWDPDVLAALRIPEDCLPRLCDSTGVLGDARALPGSPPIAALVGDQQASLIGQGCLAPGQAKATFGTGAMLDCSTGTQRPSYEQRGEAGTFPIVAWQVAGERRWGLEAVMLSAGSCLEWCCQLGLLSTPAESEELAASVRDAGGAFFVPALSGMGTPIWDFGARGAFVGLDPSIGRAQLVRSILEGIAHRGADLVEAVESDAHLEVPVLRVDGGMSANGTFLQLLADATGKVIEAAAEVEATTLGAAFLAGVAVGTWPSLEAAAATRPPRATYTPHRRLDRTRWADARAHALRSVPALSALDF